VTNTGPALTGWTITWVFTNGQVLTQLWNGTGTQSGATVTAVNPSWSAALATGATADVGFLANWTGSNTVPTSISLNGKACTAG
jgi:cellulase/cellobiase CelA1